MKSKLLRSHSQLRQHCGPLLRDHYLNYLTWAMTKQPCGAAAETSDSSLEVTSCQCSGTSVAKRYETIRQEAHVLPESRGGRRALKGWNRHALPALCDFRHGIQSFEMPNIIEGARAIFMIFLEGSWTNKRLRTLPRGSMPPLST